MVVKHHQNRHKIHRRCTFIHSIHNWKYFCKPTFIYVHIGQDGIIVLNLILSLALNGNESPLKVKFNWAKPTHPFRVGCCTFLIHESIFFTRIGTSVGAYYGNSPFSSSILRTISRLKKP